MRDMFAIVLPSGIGVRLQNLTAKQCDQALLTAAKELPPDGTMMEMGMRETRIALEAMIKQVTVGPCAGDVNAPENKWKSFDPDTYDDVFEDPRDHVVLKHAYQANHRVDPSTIAAIMGKAATVAT